MPHGVSCSRYTLSSSLDIRFPCEFSFYDVLSSPFGIESTTLGHTDIHPLVCLMLEGSRSGDCPQASPAHHTRYIHVFYSNSTRAFRSAIAPVVCQELLQRSFAYTGDKVCPQERRPYCDPPMIVSPQDMIYKSDCHSTGRYRDGEESKDRSNSQSGCPYRRDLRIHSLTPPSSGCQVYYRVSPACIRMDAASLLRMRTSAVMGKGRQTQCVLKTWEGMC